MRTLRKEFLEHDARDTIQFTALTAALKAHDVNVDEKHKENKRDNQQIKDDIAAVKTQLDDIIKLRPAIEAGLMADKEAEYRKKLFKRVVITGITTAATVGGIIPLIQLLMTIKVHFG